MDSETEMSQTEEQAVAENAPNDAETSMTPPDKESEPAASVSSDDKAEEPPVSQEKAEVEKPELDVHALQEPLLKKPNAQKPEPQPQAASAPKPPSPRTAERVLAQSQHVLPKQTPLWIRAMTQPWFRRVQEKTIVQDISRPPSIHPNSLLAAIVATLIIALQGYLTLPLPNLSVDFINGLFAQVGVPQTGWFESLPIQYSFQLPTALLVGGVLGAFLGGFSVLLFLAAGLFIAPIFANGGGLSYLYQPGFPFLAAMFFGAVFSGLIMRVAFQSRRSLRQGIYLYLGGILATVFTHGIALIGLTILLAVTSPFFSPAHPIASWWQWVVHLSLEPLPYDIMATCIFLWFIRYIRFGVYPALY